MNERKAEIFMKPKVKWAPKDISEAAAGKKKASKLRMSFILSPILKREKKSRRRGLNPMPNTMAGHGLLSEGAAENGVWLTAATDDTY